MEATRIAIAPLAGFTDASGRARRHQRHAAGAVQRHLDLQRGIASAVQRLEGADIDDMHGETPICQSIEQIEAAGPDTDRMSKAANMG